MQEWINWLIDPYVGDRPSSARRALFCAQPSAAVDAQEATATADENADAACAYSVGKPGQVSAVFSRRFARLKSREIARTDRTASWTACFTD